MRLIVGTFDVIVVGAGPGGYVAAIRCAQLGLRTAVIEKAAMGGRCLNVACIPAKAVLRCADVLTEVRGAERFGVSLGGQTPVVDFSAVARHRGEVIATLTNGVTGLLKKNRIEVIRGEATLTEQGDVRVVGERHTASKGIILATGSVKKALPNLAFGDNVIGTEEAWALDEIPTTMIVVGAGASGAEIASAYQRLGTRITLYELADRVLPDEDVEVSSIVARELKKQGIELKLGTTYEGQEAEWIVIAAGRRADVADLGLDAAGVELDADGLVTVDTQMRTTKPSIYAIGDLVSGPALAHKASDEGVLAAEAIAGLTPEPRSYPEIPRATFCSPNVASFGFTEEEAHDRGHDVIVGKVPYSAVGAAAVYGDRVGMFKIVGDRIDGAILGAHVVGARATDLIQEVVAMRLQDSGYPEIARTIHGHPTLSEGILEAARAADGWLIHG